MITIITQITACIIAAAILGFIIGWIFSLLKKDEKNQSKILKIEDLLDKKKEDLNQLQAKLQIKDKEMEVLQKEYTTMQKEIQSYSYESEAETIYISKYKELESENQMLISQIKEQQICEDENRALRDRLDKIEDEKERLLKEIEELEEYKEGYKENILKIAKLQSTKENRVIEKTKKIEKKKISNRSIGRKICVDNHIIDKRDLSSAGLKKDKLSKILNDLFFVPNRVQKS